MPFTPIAENAAVTAVTTAATYVSLHTEDPGTTGAHEVTGGAYARKQVTWTPAANSQSSAVSAAVLDVPAGTTITHWGLWQAGSGGTGFFYGGPLGAPETFGTAGTYSLTPTLAASD